MTRRRLRGALLTATLLAAAACVTESDSTPKRGAPDRAITLDLEATSDGRCCLVVTMNPTSRAQTVICFVVVFDGDRLLSTHWVPPLPPGHRRSSGFEAPPGRFEQGVQPIPIDLPDQVYRSTCRPAAWHGGAPI